MKPNLTLTYGNRTATEWRSLGYPKVADTLLRLEEELRIYTSDRGKTISVDRWQDAPAPPPAAPWPNPSCPGERSARPTGTSLDYGGAQVAGFYGLCGGCFEPVEYCDHSTPGCPPKLGRGVTALQQAVARAIADAPSCDDIGCEAHMDCPGTCRSAIAEADAVIRVVIAESKRSVLAALDASDDYYIGGYVNRELHKIVHAAIAGLAGEAP